MKNYVFLSLAALYISQGFLLAEDDNISFTTTDGIEYEGKVTRTEVTGIVLMHSKGMARIDFTRLPEDIQKKYGYDAEKSEKAKAIMQKSSSARAAANYKRQKRYGAFNAYIMKLEKDWNEKGTSSAFNPLTNQEQANIAEQGSQEVALQKKRLSLLVGVIDALDEEEEIIQSYIDAVLGEKVIIGMNESLLLLSWGSPDDKSIVESSTSKVEIWDYKRGDFNHQHITLIDGVITDFTNIKL